MSEVDSVADPGGTLRSFGDALERAESSWGAVYGRGSRRELAASFAERVEAKFAVGADIHFDALRCDVERSHRALHGVVALRREACDERERCAAQTSDGALVHYEQKWAKRLAKLQRAHPSRWSVAGLSEEEVRDVLTLRLIEALRAGPEAWGPYERAGREAGLLLLAKELRSLRKSFRLNIVLSEPSPLYGRTLSGEDELIRAQSERVFTVSRERAEAQLSRSQRRWYAAMRLSANAGDFFEASGKLNLAAVSRQLDKNRSSALRAFAELREHFTRERQKVEG